MSSDLDEDFLVVRFLSSLKPVFKHRMSKPGPGLVLSPPIHSTHKNPETQHQCMCTHCIHLQVQITIKNYLTTSFQQVRQHLQNFGSLRSNSCRPLMTITSFHRSMTDDKIWQSVIIIYLLITKMSQWPTTHLHSDHTAHPDADYVESVPTLLLPVVVNNEGLDVYNQPMK